MNYRGVPKTVTQGSSEVAMTSSPASYNELRRIFRYTQPVGTVGLIANPLDINLKLFNNSGVELAQTVRVFLAVQGSGERAPTFVADFSYSDFARLTEGQQRDIKFRDSVLKPFWRNVQNLTLRENDRFEIWIEGAGQFDATQGGNRVRFIVDELN